MYQTLVIAKRMPEAVLLIHIILFQRYINY